MVTDVCWNPPQGADVLGQELVVLIKAHCPSVPAQDLSFLWDWGFWGGNAGVRFQRDKISRNSPISAPSHSRGVPVLLAWLPLVTIDWNTGICVPLLFPPPLSFPPPPLLSLSLSALSACVCLSNLFQRSLVGILLGFQSSQFSDSWKIYPQNLQKSVLFRSPLCTSLGCYGTTVVSCFFFHCLPLLMGEGCFYVTAF